MKSPFPYFGGKSTIADRVWSALGRPAHYIEPFFGSGAVLLNRPQFDPQVHTETICDADGHVCCAPGTRILRLDLQYVPIETLRSGDRLLAFDEFNDGPRFKQAPSGYRHWKIATVLRADKITRPCVRLRFNDGTMVVCSEEHQWLSGGNRGLRWRTTKNWRSTIPRKTQRAWVFKPLSVVQPKNDYIHGWLGGFADGEGHYHGAAHGGGGSWGISLHQASGPIADKALLSLEKCGYKVRREVRSRIGHKPIEALHILGGMDSTFRFLMECRPERLIANLLQGIEKKSIYTRQGRSRVFIVEMERLGNQEVIALRTTTGTYIAEGLASHNCNVWRALQSDPDAVAKQCDWPVNHADLIARKKRLNEQTLSLLERLCADDTYFDAKLAGYWIWAASCWIGHGLIRPMAMPDVGSTGSGVHAKGKRPHLSKAGMGVHAKGQRPHLSDAGLGVQEPYNTNIYEWFRALSVRLRYVRVVCGDWSRVCGGDWQATLGPVGVFFDPPYGEMATRDPRIYSTDSLSAAADVQAWCRKRGPRKDHRIVLAGYYEEHESLIADGWRVQRWKARGGYSNMGDGETNGKLNRRREALFFSPHCLGDPGLFADILDEDVEVVV